jgi:molybdenum cofactor cytidylyltransferase
LSNCAVLILAAGSSSRMGRPKQLLKWKNTNLLSHAIRTAKKINPLEVFVVLGANFDLIKSEIELEGIKALNNKNWEKGLGNSIAFGVNYIIKSKSNIDGVLIILADQPLIDLEYLNLLVDRFRPGKQQIIASTHKNGRHGVPALFDNVYFEELSKLEEDKGAKSVLQKYSENVTAINGEHLVSDIDTLEEYYRLYNANN